MTHANDNELQHELDSLRAENRALKAELARTHSAFQEGLDCVCFLDATGRVSSANPIFAATVKLPLEEVCGRNFADFCLVEERAQLQAMLKKAATQNQVAKGEIHFTALIAAGRVHELVVTRTDSIDDEMRILAIAHDITAYKQLEADLLKRNMQLESLQKLGIELSRALDQESLLENIGSQVAELFDSVFAALGVYQPEKGRLKMVHSIGDLSPPRYIRRGKGLAGTIWKEVKPIRVANYLTWENRFTNTPVEQLGSAMGVPITWEGRFLGILEVARWEVDPFTQDDVKLLESFASLAAVALHNAQLLRTEREQRQAIEALTEATLIMSRTLDVEELLDRVLAQVERVVPGDVFDLALINSADQVQIVRARGYEDFNNAFSPDSFSLSLDSPTSQQMIATKSPLLVSDTRTDPRWRELPEQLWIRSYLGAPIYIEEEVIGFLSANGTRKEQFNEQDAKYLQLLANYASTALQHGRLYRAELEERKTIEALTQASLAVNSALEFEQVLDRILEQVAQVVTGDAYSIMVLEAGVAQVVRSRGYERFGAEGFVSSAAFTIEETENYKQMLASGEPLVIYDTRKYSGWLEVPEQAWLLSYVGAPILIKGETVGFLNVDSSHTSHFNEKDAQHLKSFANQVAATIAHARLFAQLQQRAEELETLQHTMLQVTSSLDLADVLHEVVKSTLALMDANNAHIYLYQEEPEKFIFGTALYKDGRREPAVQAPRSDGLTAHVARSGIPMIINDVAQHPWFKSKDEWGLEAIAGFPLSWGGKKLGVFTIAFTQPHTFTPAEERILGLLSDQAAIALENAQLHQQLQTHAEELELRVEERTAELRAQHARQKAIFTSTPDGLALVDASSGEILEANPVIQRWLTQTLTPEEAQRLRGTIQKLAQRASQKSEELLELTGLDLQLTTAAVEEGLSDSAVVNVHDVTHLNALNRTRARFITNVSHELRTPITIIKLYAQMLPTAPPEKLPEYFDILINETEHQAQLVKKILQISSLEGGRMTLKTEAADLNFLIAEVVDNHRHLAADKDLELIYQPPGSLIRVLVDPVPFKTAVSNLLRNALQYTTEGGQVELTIGVGRRAGRRWATVSVRDTGIGIPPAELSRIFERFYRGSIPRQEQISGTGLGLSISKGIIELHGGLITVTSEVGEGSTFVIWVPLAASLS